MFDQQLSLDLSFALDTIEESNTETNNTDERLDKGEEWKVRKYLPIEAVNKPGRP